jgi:hypothetical protein
VGAKSFDCDASVRVCRPLASPPLTAPDMREHLLDVAFIRYTHDVVIIFICVAVVLEVKITPRRRYERVAVQSADAADLLQGHSDHLMQSLRHAIIGHNSFCVADTHDATKWRRCV